MTIRSYHSEDIEAIYKLFYHSVYQVARKDYTPQQLAVWAKPQRNTQRWDEGLKQQLAWVAEVGGEIAGFTSLIVDRGYIDFLYVHHLHQGRGVATALLQTLLHEAKARHISHLTTDSSLTARPFFLSQGFHLAEENTKMVDGVAFLNSRMAMEID